MKDRCEHAALRRAARVPEREVYFQQVDVAFQNLSRGGNIQTANVVRKTINFWRDSSLTRNLNERPIPQEIMQHLLIEKQASCARRGHSGRETYLSTPVFFQREI